MQSYYIVFQKIGGIKMEKLDYEKVGKIQSKKADKLISLIENMGLFLLLDIAITLLLSTILFFVGISITAYHFFGSLIISGILLYFLSFKKKTIKSFVTVLLASGILLSGMICIESKLYDISYDGNAYHKDAIGLLKNGWNPVYDKNVKKFYQESSLRPDNFYSVQGIWEEHYAKTGWIYSASIYAVTNNIESGKALNLLMDFICFSIFISFFYRKWKKLWPTLLIALAAVFNPITYVQCMNYYNDGLLGVTLFAFVLCLIQFISNKKEQTPKLYAMIGSLLIIGVNIKYTGLAYLGLFALGLYCYYVYREKKQVLKPTIIFGLMFLISIFIVGFSSYVTNTLDHKHPLYPLFGKDKVDIMTDLQPDSFEHMSAIKKFGYSIFSETDDILKYTGREPKLKIPFTVNYDELTRFRADIRIGGWGVLFSGIFLLSIIIIILGLKRKYKEEKSEFIISMIILGTVGLLICFLSDGWWARYAPYVYFIPLFAFYFVLDYHMEQHSRNTMAYIIGYTTMIFMNVLLITPSILNHFNTSKVIAHSLDLFSKEVEKKEVIMLEQSFNGVLYNLDDRGIKYNLSYKTKETDNELYYVFLKWR